MTNLLENAVKYSGESRNIEVGLALSAGRELITSVRDHGVGIPQADRERVFERFFRARNVEQGQVVGLGLGLFIARTIVERHGGRMWLESIEGRGSTFYFALPLADGDGATEAAPDTEPAGRPPGDE